MTKHNVTGNPAPFETVLGMTDGGVLVYSCDYDTANKSIYNSSDAFVSKYEGVFTGYKYQCVELARRYWLVNFGTIFDSIPMAFDIFTLDFAREVKTDKRIPLKQIPNGDEERPEVGSLLIWQARGEFKGTGHVAVVVNVQDDFVDIVEQNVYDEVWKAGTNYSRRLKVASDPVTGAYTISCTYPDTTILGWTTLSSGLVHDPCRTCITKANLQRYTLEITPERAANRDWLDKSDPTQKLFASIYGDGLTGESRISTYYTLTQSGRDALASATAELHAMFRQATDYVVHHIDDEELIGRFNIPRKLWPKIRRSWFQRNHDTVSGRIDFCLTDDGAKVYEYNADSASTLFECGLIQDRWAKAAGLGGVGADVGGGVLDGLAETWRRLDVHGTLHLLHDAHDREEGYHTMYMQEAAERAGIRCKRVAGLEALRWSADGRIEDADGEVLANVWKTWSWTTAMNQISDGRLEAWLTELDRRALVADPAALAAVVASPPTLADVLFDPAVRVFEPLWTLLPSSKAILPVLWKLYPGHPYLLEAAFEPTAGMLAGGYAAKPVRGRCGNNVVLRGAGGEVIEEKGGAWGDDVPVYQELCLLPRFGGDAAQVNCFSSGGRYLGTVLRIQEQGHIVDVDSDVQCLRVVPDPEPLPAGAETA
jgi:glutathionylspermidine amidase/synthetase